MSSNLAKIVLPLRACSHTLAVIGLITLVGAILRLYGLGSKSLWLDEAIMYWVSRGSIGDVIIQNAVQQSSPPFFALVANLVSRIGDSEFILRMPSCLGGILAIPAMFAFARQFLSKEAAYFCALAVSLTVTLVQYSQQLREYSLTFLVSLLMLMFFYRFVHEPDLSNLVALTCSFVCGIFLQYGLGLLVLSLNLAMTVILFASRKWNLISRWVVIQLFVLGAIALVYVLALQPQMAAWSSGPGASTTSEHLAPDYWDGSLPSLAKLAVNNTAGLFYFAYPNSFLLLFILLIGGAVALNLSSGRIAILMGLFPMMITFAAACARQYPYGGIRQNIFLLPMIYLMAGFGFDYLWKLDNKRIVALVFVVVFGLSGAGSILRYFSSNPEDVKSVVATLASTIAQGDRVYVYYGAKPAFQYYYRDLAEQIVYGVESRSEPDNYWRQLDPVLAKPGKLWLVFSHCYNQECDQILDYVSHSRKTERRLGDTDVALYGSLPVTR